MADPAATQRIELVLSQEWPALERTLLEQPGISSLRIEHDVAQFDFPGDQHQQAALLRRLILAEAPLCRFRSRDDNLEDVFLNLTEGKFNNASFDTVLKDNDY